MGFAKTASHHGTGKPTVEATESPEPDDQGDDVGDQKPDTKNESSDQTHGRKLNHGFYVSAAAHCEDVDDPSTPANPDFPAPATCKTDGQDHGKFVSSVAHSSLGKPDKAHDSGK